MFQNDPFFAGLLLLVIGTSLYFEVSRSNEKNLTVDISPYKLDEEPGDYPPSDPVRARTKMSLTIRDFLIFGNFCSALLGGLL